MKIARVEATPLAIPLAQEFHWAGGAQVGANLVLFAVHTDDGVVGYGESICEDPRAVVAHGELMARQLVGRVARRHGGDPALDLDARAAGRCSRSSRRLVFAGIEVACWDALGRALGVPTRTFFGGAVHDELDYFGFLQGDDPETLAAPRTAARGRGLPRDLPQGRPRGRATTTPASPPCARRSGRSRCCGSTRTRRGTSRRRSSGSGGSSSTTSTGSSSRRRRRTSPGSRTCGARSDVKIAADQAVFTIGQLRAGAREGGGRRDRPGQPRRRRALPLQAAGVHLRGARPAASTGTRSWRARSASTRTRRSRRRSRT